MTQKYTAVCRVPRADKWTHLLKYAADRSEFVEVFFGYPPGFTADVPVREAHDRVDLWENPAYNSHQQDHRLRFYLSNHAHTKTLSSTKNGSPDTFLNFFTGNSRMRSGMNSDTWFFLDKRKE